MINDEKFMKLALDQAKLASIKNEVPIGAIIVSKEGNILGRGYNTVEHDHTQNSHAEVKAISKAGKKLKDWRLSGCTLYVTVEPCCMCLGLICLSRIERVVYGAQSPIFGYHLDKQSMPDLYKKHIKGITSGVSALQSTALLKDFFKKQREKGE
jgi:tRNA(adenine34) deaminase